MELTITNPSKFSRLRWLFKAYEYSFHDIDGMKMALYQIYINEYVEMFITDYKGEYTQKIKELIMNEI